MRMLALALGGLLAQAPDAGHWSGPEYTACPDAKDAAPAVELDGGTWLLPPPRGARVACLMESCAKALEEERAKPEPSTSLVVVGFAVGLIAGGLVGLFASRR